MNGARQFLREHRYRLGLFALFLGSIIVFAVPSTPWGDSYSFNRSWFHAFLAGLQQGEFYPRHSPELWPGSGGLDFYFYGPLPFWLASLFGTALCGFCSESTMFAVGAGAVPFIFAAIAMYWCLRLWFGQFSAFCGAAIYSLLPYHVAIDWALRQAVGEFLAYVFVPLLVRGFAQLIAKRDGGPTLALAFAAMMLSHLPSALIVVHFLAGMFVLWAICYRESWREVAMTGLQLAGWGALGLALACFYWLPSISLLDGVSPGFLYGSHFQATAWLFLDGTAAPSAEMSSRILLVLTIPILSLGLLLSSKALRQDQNIVLYALFPIVLVLFLQTVLSYPIWQYSLLSRIQFPWRTLMMSDFSVAFAGAAMISVAQARDWGRFLIVRPALIGAAILATNLVLIPVALPVLKEGHYARSTDAQHLNDGRHGALEYMPPAGLVATIGTNFDRMNYRAVSASLERHQEQAKLDVQIVDARSRSYTLKRVDDQNAQLLSPVLFWEPWQAFDAESGAVLSTRLDLETGFVRVEVLPGTELIELKMPLFLSEWVGAAISWLGLIVLVLLGRGYLERSLSLRSRPIG